MNKKEEQKKITPTWIVYVIRNKKVGLKFNKNTSLAILNNVFTFYCVF